MEKAIFRDQVHTDQLPALWNDKMEALLGIRPGNDAEAVSYTHLRGQGRGRNLGYYTT